MAPAKKIVDELHQKIDKSTHHLKEHLAGIRTGMQLISALGKRA